MHSLHTHIAHARIQYLFSVQPNYFYQKSISESYFEGKSYTGRPSLQNINQITNDANCNYCETMMTQNDACREQLTKNYKLRIKKTIVFFELLFTSRTFDGIIVSITSQERGKRY